MATVTIEYHIDPDGLLRVNIRGPVGIDPDPLAWAVHTSMRTMPDRTMRIIAPAVGHEDGTIERFYKEQNG